MKESKFERAYTVNIDGKLHTSLPIGGLLYNTEKKVSLQEKSH